MFGFGRRKSHSQLVRAELGEGFGHIRQAAGHARAGVEGRVGPQVQAARDYLSPTAARVAQTASHGWGVTMTAVAPLAMAALAGARQTGTAAGHKGSRNVTESKKMMKTMPKNKRKSMRARRRWSILTGVLAAGAVAGAVGAVAMRRRRQEPWEAYEPASSTMMAREDGKVAGGSGTSGDGATQPSGEPPASVSKPKPVTIDKVRDRATPIAEKISSGAGTGTDGAKSPAKAGAKPDGLLGTASNSSSGSRS
ncbi:hypothetical protein BDK92_3745 [Micromonospora pisi]|uniref:Uncharacterized protein n=1 Tax=Micromonospora pisi TaxID=589240 RepID=A0A495JK12_9ACTN|nr:hypothetical protein [Micromonospora pisi]RKR89400.1 hypothetical protein BDK92_3745 [Micromonospora pisi]